MSLCTPPALTAAFCWPDVPGCCCVCGIPGCGSDCRGMFCATTKTPDKANNATMAIYLFILSFLQWFYTRLVRRHRWRSGRCFRQEDGFSWLDDAGRRRLAGTKARVNISRSAFKKNVSCPERPDAPAFESPDSPGVTEFGGKTRSRTPFVENRAALFTQFEQRSTYCAVLCARFRPNNAPPDKSRNAPTRASKGSSVAVCGSFLGSGWASAGLAWATTGGCFSTTISTGP